MRAIEVVARVIAALIALPEQLRTAEGRKQALAEAKRRIEERKGRPVGPQDPDRDVEVGIRTA